MRALWAAWRAVPEPDSSTTRAWGGQGYEMGKARGRKSEGNAHLVAVHERDQGVGAILEGLFKLGDLGVRAEVTIRARHLQLGKERGVRTGYG